jgi:hypothetical protein
MYGQLMESESLIASLVQGGLSEARKKKKKAKAPHEFLWIEQSFLLKSNPFIHPEDY